MDIIRLDDKTFNLYLPESDIQSRIKELASQLNDDYAEKKPLLVPVLNGSFLFAADLARDLTVNPEIHFVRTASYGDGMQSSGKVQLVLDLEIDIRDRHVLIVEDVVDTGHTFHFLLDHFMRSAPASVRLVTLLFKPEVYVGETIPDYIGFKIPPEFVVGYGMDYARTGRELRSIYKLKEEH